MTITEGMVRQIVRNIINEARNRELENQKRRERYNTDKEYRETAKQRSRDYLNSLTPEEKEKKMEFVYDRDAKRAALADMSKDYSESTKGMIKPYHFNGIFVNSDEEKRFNMTKNRISKIFKRNGKTKSEREINDRAAMLSRIADYVSWENENKRLRKDLIDNRPRDYFGGWY